jgi:hypothetical protein
MRRSYLWTAVVLGICLAIAPGLQAAESDLSASSTVQDPVTLGTPFTVTVNYANGGPDTAVSAYVNADFIPPMGLDVFLDNYFNGDGSMYTAFQDSAAGTDTLGNVPLLFWDDFYCENIFFQLQGDDTSDATPIQPLASGASGSFTYEVALPMESPKTGTIEITEPANLAKAWTLTDPSNLWVELGLATPYEKYATTTCSKLVGTAEEDICQYITDNCWGSKVSHLDAPIEAQLELVDDGSADPTLGCGALVGFTPGNIALLRRGTCEFGAKGFNAEQAGAVAVFMVNDGRCSDFPDSDQCVLNMGPGDLGGLVTIPVVLVSVADGEPVISAVEGGASVMGAFGTSSTWSADVTAFLAEATDTDPDDANSTDSVTVGVNAVPPAPVAAFTYAPAAPITGSPVQFTDASTGGAPTTWAWDFGDGGTSTEQSPAHTFTSAGTFAVSLTASNAGGSSMASMDVTVTLGAELTEAYFVPAAALAAGLEGAFFQTDVDLNNGGATDASYAFLWLPRGQDNSTPTQSATFNVAAGASVRYSNVLAEVFSAEPDVAGALAVLSNSGDLNIMSRTYNLPTAKAAGTFGQALPGVPAGDLILQNETKRIIFMSENADLRANLGCVNGVNDSVRIKLDLYGDDGALLESRNMDLGPWSNNQFNQIFAAYAPTNGYVDVSAAKAGAAYYCYGSVLDNGSNDPTSILPTEYGSATTYFVPAAALAAGQEGSFFQTDVDINNAGSTMATYQFLWLPRGVDNSSPTTSESFTLEAGASVRYENVLEEVFDAAPDVAGALAITSDTASLGIMSRTYNLPTAKVAGTFGQDIPGIPADQLIMQGETKRIIFMSENDDFRANFGCVNGVNDSVRVNISMYDDTGALLGTRNMDLPAWSNNQFNQILNDFSPTDGYIDFVANKAGAAIYCYGSVLDNGSSDPTTILPQ